MAFPTKCYDWRSELDYYIIKPGGEKWGPVSIESLNRAIDSKTVLVPRDAMLEETETGSRLRASLVPGLVVSAPSAGPRRFQPADGQRYDPLAAGIWTLLIAINVRDIVLYQLTPGPLMAKISVALSSSYMVLGFGLISALLLATRRTEGLWTTATAALILTTKATSTPINKVLAVPYFAVFCYCLWRLFGYPTAREPESELKLPDSPSSIA